MSPRNRAGESSAEPPERRTTPKKQSTFDSLRRRGTGASSTTSPKKGKEKGPFQEHFSCYDGLTWEALEGYLVGKWPWIGLVERKEMDQWLFEIPERLTEEDKINIAALRDSNAVERRRQVTPE